MESNNPGKTAFHYLLSTILPPSHQQQEKSPINTKSLLKRLYSLASHPSAAKRLGAALAFNSIYTIFRLVDTIAHFRPPLEFPCLSNQSKLYVYVQSYLVPKFPLPAMEPSATSPLEKKLIHRHNHVYVRQMGVCTTVIRVLSLNLWTIPRMDFIINWPVLYEYTWTHGIQFLCVCVCVAHETSGNIFGLVCVENIHV